VYDAQVLARSLTLLLLCALARAQCPGSWASGFGPTGANSRVTHFAVGDLGGGPALYAGGWFFEIAGVQARQIAKWDGVAWSPLGTGLPIYPSAMAVLDDGSGPALYVAGGFQSAGGVPTPSGIAKWNGSAWSALPGGIPTPKALAMYDDGTGLHLHAGGAYAPCGVMKLVGGAWVPVAARPPYTTATVNTMQVIDHGAGPCLYVGGSVSSPLGSSGFYGRWNGTFWEGALVNGAVNALAAMNDPAGVSVFVGGSFNKANGFPAANVACVIGPATGPLGAGIGGVVSSLLVFDDGSGAALHATGTFTSAGGAPAAGVARWNGSQWQPLATGIGSCGGTVSGLALASFGSGGVASLVLAGEFTRAGSRVVNNVAAWDGSAWHAVPDAPTLGIDPNVAVMKRGSLPTGDALFVSGPCYAGSSMMSGVLKYDATGWHPTGSPLSAATLEAWDDGSGIGLYAGSTGLWRFDGVTWTTLGTPFTSPYPSTEPSVTVLKVYDDGSGPSLFVGGIFDSVAAVPASNIAKWNGVSWSALGAGVTGTPFFVFYPNPRVLEPFDDGTGPALYVVGYFTFAGGQPAQGLAKWDGVGWTPIPTGFTSFLQTIDSLAAFDDGTGPALYAAGTFGAIGGLTAPGFAKWTGQAWMAATMPPGAATTDGVSRLAVVDDGSGPALYATVKDAASLRTLRRWNGSTWTSLGSFGESVGLIKLATYDDGSGPAVFAAGSFLSAGGAPASGFAKWVTPKPALTLTAAAGSGVTIANAHLTAGSEYFNLFSTAPCAGPPGFGPYLGLCGSDPSELVGQFLLPLGTLPFHFSAGGTTATFGPYLVPSGMTLDAVCFEWAGVVGCRSQVVRLTVP
jgi:hypothetical protein